MGTDREILERLLAGNRRHVASLPDGYFADVQTGQHPTVVAVCCSDSRVAHEGMWGVDRPGAVFTPSNIGNQVWDDDGGQRIIDGSVLYPIHHTGTDAVAVVGHTGCGAVTAAYRVATGADPPGPRGVDKWVDMLVPVVEAALESDLIDREAADDAVINRLVEYNVGYQVRSLRDADAFRTASTPTASSTTFRVSTATGPVGPTSSPSTARPRPTRSQSWCRTATSRRSRACCTAMERTTDRDGRAQSSAVDTATGVVRSGPVASARSRVHSRSPA